MGQEHYFSLQNKDILWPEISAQRLEISGKLSSSQYLYHCTQKKYPCLGTRFKFFEKVNFTKKKLALLFMASNIKIPKKTDFWLYTRTPLY